MQIRKTDKENGTGPIWCNPFSIGPVPFFPFQEKFWVTHPFDGSSAEQTARGDFFKTYIAAASKDFNGDTSTLDSYAWTLYSSAAWQMDDRFIIINEQEQKTGQVQFGVIQSILDPSHFFLPAALLPRFIGRCKVAPLCLSRANPPVSPLQAAPSP